MSLLVARDPGKHHSVRQQEPTHIVTRDKHDVKTKPIFLQRRFLQPIPVRLLFDVAASFGQIGSFAVKVLHVGLTSSDGGLCIAEDLRCFGFQGGQVTRWKGIEAEGFEFDVVFKEEIVLLG